MFGIESHDIRYAIATLVVEKFMFLPIHKSQVIYVLQLFVNSSTKFKFIFFDYNSHQQHETTSWCQTRSDFLTHIVSMT